MSALGRLWARFKTEPTTSAPVVLGLHVPGRTAFPKRNPAEFVREAFLVNTTVYACVMLIARTTSTIPWVLYRRTTGGRTSAKGIKGVQKVVSPANALAAWGTFRKAIELAEVEDHPLLTLLERPNPWQGGTEFFEADTAYLLLSGNNYIKAAGPATGQPRELYNLRPDRVRVVPGTQERVDGYHYGPELSGEDYAPAQVCHLRTFNPDDDYYGLSPLEAATRVIDTDNEALRWNYALLSNDARPPGAFVSKLPLPPPTRAELKKSIASMVGGSRNAGRPLLLDGDLDWRSFSYAPSEMGWREGRKDAKREIAQVFGIAPELIGDGENKTYSNFSEARKALYMEVALPYNERRRDSLNNWLADAFGNGLRLDFDRDQIDALQEDQAKLWDRVERATDLTINEKRRAKGYDDIAGGDVVLVSSAYAPLTTVVNAASEGLEPPGWNTPGAANGVPKPQAAPGRPPDSTPSPAPPAPAASAAPPSAPVPGPWGAA